MRIEQQNGDEWTALVHAGHVDVTARDAWTVTVRVTGLDADGNQVACRVTIAANEFDLMLVGGAQ